MDWQKFIFDPSQNIIGLMENIAYKRFYEHDIADSAFNYCLDELGKNNWAKLNKYNGKNQIKKTMLSVGNRDLNGKIKSRKSLMINYHVYYGGKGVCVFGICMNIQTTH